MRSSIAWVVFGIFFLVLSAFIYREYSKIDVKADWQLRELKMAELQTELKKNSEEVKRHQGTSRCQRDDQCKVLGLGTPVCNLHKNFIIYSTFDAQEEKLIQAVKQFNENHQKMNDLGLKTGECGKKSEQIRCVNQRCIPVREK